MRNNVVNSNCTACVDTDIVLAVQYQRHRGTFCLPITTPLHLESVLLVFCHCLKSVEKVLLCMFLSYLLMGNV